MELEFGNIDLLFSPKRLNGGSKCVAAFSQLPLETRGYILSETPCVCVLSFGNCGETLGPRQDLTTSGARKMEHGAVVWFGYFLGSFLFKGRRQPSTGLTMVGLLHDLKATGCVARSITINL